MNLLHSNMIDCRLGLALAASCPDCRLSFLGRLVRALAGVAAVSTVLGALTGCSSPGTVERSYEGSESEVRMKDASVGLVNLDHEESFREMVLESPVPVIVDFWAPWCGPCRAQAPILEDLAGAMGDDIRIVKVNVDELPRLAGKYSVQAIPTLILFDNGKRKARLVGLQSEDDLRQALDL